MILKRKIMMVFFLLFSSLLFGDRAPNFLLIQKARTGSLTKLHKNHYLLTLNNLSPRVYFYHLNPKKYGGVLALSRFLTLWHDNKMDFSGDNSPNAIISLYSPRGKQQLLVALVNNPGFDTGGAIQYQITVVGSKPVESGEFKSIKLYFYNIAKNPEAFQVPLPVSTGHPD